MSPPISLDRQHMNPGKSKSQRKAQGALLVWATN
jgi:hypothetical protein